ncbi:flagellar hook-associated protein FlgL [Haloimpatiens sp. FM7330]|uniref:flagellar hook-associated protein FlgL n=1 Tax=Haloimpatiens sp. FM7330 TaxID=3298610 RepID=UPI003631F1BB
MRVTNRMLSNQFLNDMRLNLTNMKKLQEQLTSGKEFRRPSDDPFNVVRAMQLHTEINTNKQYNSNIKDTINWLDVTDTALGQAGDVLKRIDELLISAGNAGYSENERSAVKDEINEKIGEFSQILNTSFDGKYVFGGTRGTTKPVDVEGGIKYKNAEPVKIDIDKLNEAITNKKTGDTIGFKLNYDTTNNVQITLSKKSYTDAAELSKDINSQLDGSSLKGKLRVASVYNGKEQSIRFISENDSEINITDCDLGTDNDTVWKGKTIEKTVVEGGDTNTRIMYYKKGGGELSPSDPQYDMINQKLTVEISQGVKMDYNVNAREVLEFNGKDMRDMFKNIVNHLDGKDDNGENVDVDAVKKLVNEDLQNIKDAMNNVLKLRSEVGAKQNRMDSAKSKNEDQNFNMTEILSNTEDINVTEKTMEFAVMQTVYIASLQTSAKVLQPTLMDYIR